MRVALALVLLLTGAASASAGDPLEKQFFDYFTQRCEAAMEAEWKAAQPRSRQSRSARGDDQILHLHQPVGGELPQRGGDHRLRHQSGAGAGRQQDAAAFRRVPGTRAQEGRARLDCRRGESDHEVGSHYCRRHRRAARTARRSLATTFSASRSIRTRTLARSMRKASRPLRGELPRSRQMPRPRIRRRSSRCRPHANAARRAAYHEIKDVPLTEQYSRLQEPDMQQKMGAIMQTACRTPGSSESWESMMAGIGSRG